MLVPNINIYHGRKGGAPNCSLSKENLSYAKMGSPWQPLAVLSLIFNHTPLINLFINGWQLLWLL